MLLEPSAGVPRDPLRLAASGRAPSGAADAPGRVWLGDPDTARTSLSPERRAALAAALEKVVEAASAGAQPGPISISNRDVVRCLNYMAYFVLLAEASNPRPAAMDALAAENALLHFVLPGLPPEDFRSCFDALLAKPTQLQPESADPAIAGGQLMPRLERLARASTRFAFAEALDFWASLS